MVKSTISRAEFARLAGVTGAAVTKACAGPLKCAVVGKRIDASHPVAVEYLASKKRASQPPPATGLDNLYEDAVAACTEANRFTASFIQRKLKVGYNRSCNLLDTMRVAGIAPGEPVVRPPATPKQEPHMRGVKAARESKKREAPQDQVEHEVPENIEAFADMTLRELIGKFGTDLRFVDWLKASSSIETIHEKRLKNAETQGRLVSRDLVKQGVIEPINGVHTRILTDAKKSIVTEVAAMAKAGEPVSEMEAAVAEVLSSIIKPVKSRIAKALRNA